MGDFGHGWLHTLPAIFELKMHVSKKLKET